MDSADMGGPMFGILLAPLCLRDRARRFENLNENYTNKMQLILFALDVVLHAKYDNDNVKERKEIESMLIRWQLTKLEF